MLGSVPEPKTIRIDTNRTKPNIDDLSKHRESYSDNKESSGKSELPHLLIHIGVGRIIAAAGAILLFILWPSYSGSNVSFVSFGTFFTFSLSWKMIKSFLFRPLSPLY